MKQKPIRIDRYRGTELIGTKFQPVFEKNTAPAVSGSSDPAPTSPDDDRSHIGLGYALVYTAAAIFCGLMAALWIPAIRDAAIALFGLK